MSKMDVKSVDEFKQICEQVRARKGYRDPLAFGVARIERGQLNQDKILQASYAVVNFKESFLSAATFVWALEKEGVNVDFSASEFVCDLTPKIAKKIWKLFGVFANDLDKHKNVAVIAAVREAMKSEENKDKFKIAFIFEDVKPKSAETIYLKLYLLWLGRVPSGSVVLEDALDTLPSVAWCADGRAIELEWLRQNEINLKMSGTYPAVLSVGKFPPYLSHIIPANSVLDAAAAQIGAHLASGAAAGEYENDQATIGEDGETSGMGVLSSVNTDRSRLLSPNSLASISLGDDRRLDAGGAVLTDTDAPVCKQDRAKLALINPDFKFKCKIYKGAQLARLSDIKFSHGAGQITASANKRATKRNEVLH